MKTLVLTLVTALLSSFTAQAFSADMTTYRGYSGNSYIFVEGGVEFSVFPDGQFDFVYLGNQGTHVSIQTPNAAINFNSGYNYDTYVQYDLYGAVIQIENVPVFYDVYGRIVQAGNVHIHYNNNRLVRIGGMHIFYNPYGYFSHYTGFINPFNRFYVYRPWHMYYMVPFHHYAIVYGFPYRRYYNPVRYSFGYHQSYYNRPGVAYMNGRRDFYRPGSQLHYRDGRMAANTNFNNGGRGNTDNATTYRRDDRVLREQVRGNGQVANTNAVRGNSSAVRTNNSSVTQSNRNNERVSGTSVTRAPQSNTGNREVRPVNTQVQRTPVTTSNRTPQVGSTSNRSTPPAARPANTSSRPAATARPASNSQKTTATRATTTRSNAGATARGGRG